ncbi:MAG: DinB family protein [Vicinamibacterales bacterium]
MLQMMRDLIAHKVDANTMMFAAIREHPDASNDRELLELLHHILVSNRFWTLTCQALPFDREQESIVPETLDQLIRNYEATQRQENAWVASLSEVDLVRTIDSPLIAGARCTVSQALMQVCLHSQGHRAQCAKMLRRLGGTPPMTDFILWLARRGAQVGG